MMRKLRITFTKGEEIKYISHLDLLRAWERLLRRAKVPLAFSKGFNPHPKISVAAPLSVGIIGDAELMDVTLDDDVTPKQFLEMVEPQMPAGLRVVDIEETPFDEPSLQSRLSFAEYSVDLAPSVSIDDVERRISAFMAAEKIERQRRRPADKAKSDRKPDQSYDLRSLVDDIWIEELDTPDDAASQSCQPSSRIRLHLYLRIGPAGSKNGSSGVARPDEMLDALGLAEHAEDIRRTRLVIESLI